VFGTLDHMPRSLEPLQRANLPSSIADRIRRQIASGQLKPGEQLPGHRELATMFSVSVGSVREAISMLVSEGLIATRAGHGTFVAESSEHIPTIWSGSPLDRGKVEELIDAREVLEGAIAAMAAERATSEQIEKLRSIIERMQEAHSDAATFLAADVELHLLLAEAANNRYLLKAMGGIRSMLRRDLELGAELSIRRVGDLQFAVDEHRRVVESIAARDPEGARAAMINVIGHNREFVLGMYTHASTSDTPDSISAE
jgi:GntR family transcriptional regulator, transcriptional repressor for pyruvate dehydrogenase complex